MKIVQVKRKDLDRILNTASQLVDDVEKAISQDEIARQRLGELKSGAAKPLTEDKIDAHLKSRGLQFD